MGNKAQLFGTTATEYINSEFNFLAVVKRLFTLQPVTFWLLTYVISLIIYQFLRLPVSFIGIIAAINFILFPFAVIFVGSIANLFIFSVPQLYRLLYPTYKNLSHDQNTVMFVVRNIVKAIIYVFVWNYTFVVGIVGLVVSINHARKLAK